MKKLLILILALALGVCLAITKPSSSDFAEWYVEQNKDIVSSLLKDPVETMVRESTEEDTHLFFTTFTLGDEQYYGLAGHFIGSRQIDQGKETLHQLVEAAKSALNQ